VNTVSRILGAYHRIDEHYEASALLFKRKLIVNGNGNDTDAELSRNKDVLNAKKSRIMNLKELNFLYITQFLEKIMFCLQVLLIMF